MNDTYEPLAVDVDTGEYIDDKGATPITRQYLQEWLREHGVTGEVEQFADALMTISVYLNKDRNLWKAADKVSDVRIEKVQMR